jgi:hypothetical protein
MVIVNRRQVQHDRDGWRRATKEVLILLGWCSHRRRRTYSSHTVVVVFFFFREATQYSFYPSDRDCKFL